MWAVTLLMLDWMLLCIGQTSLCIDTNTFVFFQMAMHSELIVSIGEDMITIRYGNCSVRSAANSDGTGNVIFNAEYEEQGYVKAMSQSTRRCHSQQVLLHCESELFRDMEPNILYEFNVPMHPYILNRILDFIQFGSCKFLRREAYEHFPSCQCLGYDLLQRTC